MAKQIIESFIDDLDGSKASGTTKFSIDGTIYEIDLSGQNRKKLEKALAPFLKAARPVKGERSGRGRRGAGSSNRAISREKSSEIRQWAKAQGLTVNERGRIAAAIVEKYEAAH
ncbi:histone-like nucleoid-structuring protein Lsr2 [Nonomuraea sp. NPDC002799]